MKRVWFLLLLIVIISCGKKEEKIETASNDIKVEQSVQNEQSSENKESDKTVSETSEEIEIIKFTTDGKTHFDKIVGHKFSYPDSYDEFEITKEKDGYYITTYNYGEEGEKEEPEINKIKMEVYKNIYLKAPDSYYYAYDTKHGKVAVIDPEDISKVRHFAELEK